jgi:hypothetical protein
MRIGILDEVHLHAESACARTHARQRAVAARRHQPQDGAEGDEENDGHDEYVQRASPVRRCCAGGAN